MPQKVHVCVLHTLTRNPALHRILFVLKVDFKVFFPEEILVLERLSSSLLKIASHVRIVKYDTFPLISYSDIHIPTPFN